MVKRYELGIKTCSVTNACPGKKKKSIEEEQEKGDKDRDNRIMNDDDHINTLDEINVCKQTLCLGQKARDMT